MCGILAVIDKSLSSEYIQRLSILIDKRGPDYSSPILTHTAKCGVCLKLKSSVLHLRGRQLQRQPLIDEGSNVLLFNGLIYRFGGEKLPAVESDTSFIARRLAGCETKAQVADILAGIDGPFAIVYWHNSLNTIFYCRDIFGRKSLCVLRNNQTEQILVISSVSHRNHLESSHWEEVDSQSIHCIQYDGLDSGQPSRFDWAIENIYPRTSKCLQDLSPRVVAGRISPALNGKLNADPTDNDCFDAQELLHASIGLGERLLDAVSNRFDKSRKDCIACRRLSQTIVASCDHSKVAVAFSGGLDSTLIALALDKITDKKETIDLVNVAFKDNSPDRISASCAFYELIKVSSHRNWRFVVCDVSLDELQEERESIIKDLILPCNTVIDDSLGCACWFIGRAKGRSVESKMMFGQNFDMDGFLKYNPDYSSCHNAFTCNPYTCQASLWFVGSAIDEQLGGYNSHKVAWRQAGFTGLYNEISFQMRRLSSRNLGRDDRCYSHHGLDVNLPFLDFNLVQYLNQLPLGLKMNLDESPSSGPKKILRQLATAWGLHDTGSRVKKAMQFGSKIANLEDDKEKGNDICSRLRVS